MIRTATVLALLTFPVYAGDTALGPMASLVPQEWKITVFEVSCHDLRDCCDLYGPCSVPYQRRPDPVPLPGAGAMMLALVGFLICLPQLVGLAGLLWLGRNDR